MNEIEALRHFNSGVKVGQSQERQRILDILNESQLKELAPAQLKYIINRIMGD